MAKIKSSKFRTKPNKSPTPVKLIKVKSKEVTKPYNPIDPKGKADIKGWWKWGKAKLNPGATYLINMELRNGMHTFFVLTTNKAEFDFKEGRYIIDDESKYFVLDANKYALDYHQDISLPIKRIIPVTEINKAISALNNTEVETAINPTSLKSYVESNFIQQVMKGQELSESLKKITLIAGVAALAAVMHLVIFIFKSGMLSSIKIPGMG